MLEIPIAATGVLRSFAEAGMLAPIDFHLARRLGQLGNEDRPEVQLAFALATRELRLGSVCIDLSTAATDLKPEDAEDDGIVETEAPLPWPEPQTWIAAVAASPAVAPPDPEAPGRPFRLDGTLLYLDRYWREERRLAAALQARSRLAPLSAHTQAPAPPAGIRSDDRQDEAVRQALNLPTVVITGGPGTGKTTIVGRILNALSPESPRVALAAPTGRAAGRLKNAVEEVAPTVPTTSSTLHRLLGARPRSAAVEYGPGNPVPYDVVVVDETSMVSLEMMGQLLAAVSDTTRLILLGDPHQLRSVDAGAVLADIERADDLVTAPGGALVRLEFNYRSDPNIHSLAQAILAGDSALALRTVEESPELSLTPFDKDVEPMSLAQLAADVVPTATEVREKALAGDGDAANEALEKHRILCGHREGAFGVSHWGRSARAALALQLPDYGYEHQPYVGQPLLVQRNSDLFSNGDTGVVCAVEGRLLAAFEAPNGAQWIDPMLLDDVTDLHAMTIHKSQGSQFDAVSVVLPPIDSPLLTRELLYTAVTRARHAVRLYGSPEAFAQAVETPVRRASGLSAGRSVRP